MFVSCARRAIIRRHLDSKKINNWVCVYNENASISALKKFDLAVLDADAHPDLTALKNSPTILIGYVSLGEVGSYRWYWPFIANKPWILDKNPNWDGRMIDVRAAEWHDWVIEKIIPRILAKGFDGIFLDTIDNAAYLEKYHPEKKYPGAQASMIHLIKAIRNKFPKKYILVNRGSAILNEIGAFIDGVVAESIFSAIDLNAKQKLRSRTADEYEPEVQKLLAARKKFNLMVFTLDYTETENNKFFIRDVIAKARQNDFIPYISTTKLDSVYLYTQEL
ncbi:MAG: endo alpha-1,4 polygalactosaminidase [bacterium]